MKQSIALVSIVRDEADTIGGMIDSAHSIIDRVVLLDTGSTDGTEDVARSACLAWELPVEIAHAEWTGFGPARSRALELGRASGAEYLLMLDADHRLHVDADLPPLDQDAYLVGVRGRMSWKLPLMTRAGHAFTYKGAAHSYLSSPEHTTEGDVSDILWIEGGPAPSEEKIAADLPLLQAELDREPNNTRTMFYLAQTYKDMERYVESAAMYRRRIESGGWDQERFWSAYQLGLIIANEDFDAAIPVLLEAWAIRPRRVEPLWVLANGYSKRGDTFLARHFAEIGSQIGPPVDTLFVLSWMYSLDAWAAFL